MGKTLTELYNTVYFEIQTDHLIPARSPKLVVIEKKKIKVKKRTYRIEHFAQLVGHRVKNQRKRKERQVL